MSVLRDGLLDGIAVALAGQADERGHLDAGLQRLGARTAQLPPSGGAGTEPGAWAGEQGPLNGLVFDAARAFASGGQDRLTATLDAAWSAVLELATDLIAAQRPGKLLLLAPAPGAGRFAPAAREGLVNLARTLSIEWARYGITTCAVLPGDQTTAEELSELVGYLLSRAGDYFSGCAMELGAVDQAPPRAGSSAQGTITASS